jgi:hypothetical protein
MNIFSVLLKLGATLWPLIREYVLSDGIKGKGLGANIVAIIVGGALILITMVTVYLGEQAKQNLTIQEPIIKQYNDLTTENENLKARVTELQNSVFQCETRSHKVIEECQATLKQFTSKGKYIYDVATKTMVLKQTDEIKKLNLKQLTRLFSEHTIDTKRAILINHILEEETFEKIPRNKVLEINNKFKSIVEKDVVNYEFCSFDDDIITFKGNNNYEIIYNLTKQKINPKKLKQTLKNYNNYSKESFFNIIREFKTYIIKNDIYNIIIDKELLFQFVDEASINEYYNSIKISDLSIEEESLYKLY